MIGAAIAAADIDQLDFCAGLADDVPVVGKLGKTGRARKCDIKVDIAVRIVVIAAVAVGDGPASCVSVCSVGGLEHIARIERKSVVAKAGSFFAVGIVIIRDAPVALLHGLGGNAVIAAVIVVFRRIVVVVVTG